MDEKIFWVLLAIALFVFLGPLKLSNVRVTGGERYRQENLRYNTPGRNQRQRQLAQDREERKERKMGQSQSSQDIQDDPATGTLEPEIQEDPEAVAKRNEEERARRAAAAEARLKKDKSNSELARKLIAQKKAQKGKSALEQASVENKGWRDADEMANMRSYN